MAAPRSSPGKMRPAICEAKLECPGCGSQRVGGGEYVPGLPGIGGRTV